MDRFRDLDSDRKQKRTLVSRLVSALAVMLLYLSIVKVVTHWRGERIANKYNYPVVFASAKRIKRGYYTFEIFPVVKENSDPYNITDQFVDFLQNKIKESPSEYFWTHNRFKYKDLYTKFNSGN